jgi:D-amino-acid oxidase
MALISVLGGGVSGITTATALRLLGHDVCIYTNRRVDRAYGSHDPMTASLYPAASVIPHTVTIDDPAAHLADSQAVFDVLREDPTFGVRQQLHFEMFEPGARPQGVPDPPYAPALRDFARCLAPAANTSSVPSPVPPLRSGAESASGWRYEVTFVETPTYFRALFALFESLGGVVREKHIIPGGVTQLPGDLFVNALGGAATDIFPDPRPASYLRGVLLLVDSPGLPKHRDAERPVSYNYTPDPSVYAMEDGSPVGVYAYPRRDVWVLGGSKQPGHIVDGKWHGESVGAETFSVPGIDGSPAVDVPRPVLDLNEQLLRDLTGVSIAGRDMRATFGYRYARDLSGGGVRLETTHAHDGRPVVHNTGHGGAGVTLSWSCALRVAHVVRSLGARNPDEPRVPGTIGGARSPIVRRLCLRLNERLRGITSSYNNED